MEHGTKAGYDRHRRAAQAACDDCKAAKADHERRMREQRSKRLADLEHPSHMAWGAGCRCWACTDWHRALFRDYYNRKRLSA